MIHLARDLEVAGPSLTAEVSAGIPPLIAAGHLERILLAHDICRTTNVKTYGGPEFTFIQEKILPHLRTLGVTRADRRHHGGQPGAGTHVVAPELADGSGEGDFRR